MATEELRPNSDYDSPNGNDWQRSAGTDSYALIDDDPDSPNDSDYIYDTDYGAVIGGDERFGLTTPTYAGEVTDITVKVRVKKGAGIESGYVFVKIWEDDATQIGGTEQTANCDSAYDNYEVSWAGLSYATGELDYMLVELNAGSGSSSGGLFVSACEVILTYTPSGSTVFSGINVGDTFKSVTAVQINVGDSWKDITAIAINVGDDWKDLT